MNHFSPSDTELTLRYGEQIDHFDESKPDENKTKVHNPNSNSNLHKIEKLHLKKKVFGKRLKGNTSYKFPFYIQIAITIKLK